MHIRVRIYAGETPEGEIEGRKDRRPNRCCPLYNAIYSGHRFLQIRKSHVIVGRTEGVDVRLKVRGFF